jgi:hypothetical protein
MPGLASTLPRRPTGSAPLARSRYPKARGPPSRRRRPTAVRPARTRRFRACQCGRRTAALACPPPGPTGRSVLSFPAVATRLPSGDTATAAMPCGGRRVESPCPRPAPQPDGVVMADRGEGLLCRATGQRRHARPWPVRCAAPALAPVPEADRLVLARGQQCSVILREHRWPDRAFMPGQPAELALSSASQRPTELSQPPEASTCRRA